MAQAIWHVHRVKEWVQVAAQQMMVMGKGRLVEIVLVCYLALVTKSSDQNRTYLVMDKDRGTHIYTTRT